MEQKIQKFIVVLSVFLLFSLLVSCNSTAEVSSGDDNPSVKTAAAMTVQVIITQIAWTPTIPIAPRITSSPVGLPPTAAGKPTAEPTLPIPSLTVVPPTVRPVNASPTMTQICDLVEFVDDISIADDTVLAPGAAFMKTWRLKNAGSCTWTVEYRLVFDSGDAMEAPAAITLPKDVSPGEFIDLSLTMKAPPNADSYQGFWKMQNQYGTKFGIGKSGDKPFWVKVIVGEPTPTS